MIKTPAIYTKFLKAGIVYCLFLLVVFRVNSQTDTSKNTFLKTYPNHLYFASKDSQKVKQKDITDVINFGVFKVLYGKPDTVLKRKGVLYPSVFPAVGYTLHTKFLITISSNGAFYTDDPEKVNLSVINLSGTYTHRRQLYFPLVSNIWTKKNKYNFVGRWVYLKYPEFTYGLGGHTSLKNAIPIEYKYLLFRETILKQISQDFFLGVGYNLDYHWGIIETPVPGISITDFQRYGFHKKSIASGITLNLLNDTRRNPINPTKGHFENIVYRTNFKFLGSDANWQSLLLDFRKYFKVSKSSVLGFWSYNNITIKGRPPYLDLPSTMWDTYANQGRGYIQSRFRSKNLLALESEFRYPIAKNGLLGGVIFVNAQSVSDWPDNYFSTIWPAAGAGIRIKVNKHSNTNVSIDYAIGKAGSRGLFCNLGEVF